MPVLQPLWRHYRNNCQLLRSLVVSVGPFMVIWVGMHVPYILYIAVVCVAINGQKSPRCVGTH